MKKSILILLSVFCLNGFSQSSILLTNSSASATLAANEIVVVTTTASTNVKTTFDITNTSTSTKSYNAKRYDIVLHSAASTTASAYFCFAGSCYGDQVFVSPTSLTLTAGQSASELQGSYNMLIADLDEAATVGYSLVKYTFVNTANANDSVQISVKYNAVLGVNEITNNALSSLELFPNPANEVTFLKVNSQKAMDAKVIVCNALGAVVFEKPVSILEGKNKIEVNVANLSSGVYFAQIKTLNGTVTKKLVVK
ncbi:MAG: T9SS type A sorting domain-containing protein [Bacteroidota bacterium]|nr:T9SS type A sorting domain-containing protein [Bacteroidota bacterium]MDP3146273.1 T9SS type A sorting domain-containing protein [Bacteroidota bacterium]MDP3556379.1 T9SS type A sorting domain-containing protein [Bacteroidota bacterium]